MQLWLADACASVTLLQQMQHVKSLLDASTETKYETISHVFTALQGTPAKLDCDCSRG